MAETSHLDDLVIGKLPEHVLSAIGKMEITLDEYHESESKGPVLFIVAKNGYIDIKIRLHISTKKLIIAASSVVSLLGVAAKIISDNWPTIQTMIK